MAERVVDWTSTTCYGVAKAAPIRSIISSASIDSVIIECMSIPRNRVGTDSLGRPIRQSDPYLRVMAKTERRGECLEFTGRCNAAGYGRIAVNNSRQALAHRVVWQRHHPDEAMPPVVMHICDNPPCVELSHLRAGTRADNSADMVAKGRQPWVRGERSGRAKLTSRDVDAIRAEHAAGTRLTVLAARYSVHPAHLSRIVRGLRRAHG